MHCMHGGLGQDEAKLHVKCLEEENEEKQQDLLAQHTVAQSCGAPAAFQNSTDSAHRWGLGKHGSDLEVTCYTPSLWAILSSLTCSKLAIVPLGIVYYTLPSFSTRIKDLGTAIRHLGG